MRKLPRVGLHVLLVAVFFVASSPDAPAADKNWIGGSGNWSPGNWSPAGVPGAGDTVNIAHNDGTARIVTLNTNTPGLGLVHIDLTGAGTSGNSVSMPNNNSFTANAITVGGHNGVATTSGRGAINQSTGTTTISNIPGGHLTVGWGSGSRGTYTLEGGALVANNSEFIGYSGDGTFNHAAGTNTINGTANHLYVGCCAGGHGDYTISGTASLNVGGDAIIGVFGTGTLSIFGQSSVHVSNELNVGSTSTVNLNGGTLRFNTVSGLNRLFFNSGTIKLTGDRTLRTDPLVNNFFPTGPGINIKNGKSLYIEGDADVDVNTNVDSGSKLTVGNTLSIFGSLSTPSTPLGLVVGPGGTVSSLGGIIAENTYARVTGAGAFWTSFEIDVGLLNAGRLEIENQGTVDTDFLFISPYGTVTLNGGTIKFDDYDRRPGGVFNFMSGTIDFGSISGLGIDARVREFFGDLIVIPDGKELAATDSGAITSFNAPVVLDGGKLTLWAINGAASRLSLNRGTLHVLQQNLVVGPVTTSLGTIGEVLDLGPDVTINSNSGVTNNGLVTGDGQIGGTFTNTAAGELRGEPGKSLKLTGGSNNNFGRINLYGGMVEFTQILFNNAGAFISGNGTLKTSTLYNSGTMNFAGTANILGSVVNEAGGKIISGGGGATIFYGDVTNSGEIRTSTNGFTVFFGDVSGGGTFTGTGTVNFEGDLSPGSSPGTVSFVGDVVLGPSSTLQIELGGTVAGTQYDRINVAGDLTLNGTLKISLINGFTPGAGQTFDFLNAGSVAGAFSSLQLPALPGLTWNTSQLASGIVTVVSGLPGDYNNNGKVDAADYVVWRENPGGIYTPNDYTTWRASFGNPPGSGAGLGGQSVPEPSAILVALTIFVGSLPRRAGR
jgi:T5SS/PEP-CTERM-associated repeat protein